MSLGFFHIVQRKQSHILGFCAMLLDSRAFPVRPLISNKLDRPFSFIANSCEHLGDVGGVLAGLGKDRPKARK